MTTISHVDRFNSNDMNNEVTTPPRPKARADPPGSSQQSGRVFPASGGLFGDEKAGGASDMISSFRIDLSQLAVRQLGTLSIEEVCRLMFNYRLGNLEKIIRSMRIDGVYLDSIGSLADLCKAGINFLPPLRLKLLAIKIIEDWQVNGIPIELILPLNMIAGSDEGDSSTTPSSSSSSPSMSGCRSSNSKGFHSRSTYNLKLATSLMSSATKRYPDLITTYGVWAPIAGNVLSSLISMEDVDGALTHLLKVDLRSPTQISGSDELIALRAMSTITTFLGDDVKNNQQYTFRSDTSFISKVAGVLSRFITSESIVYSGFLALDSLACRDNASLMKDIEVRSLVLKVLCRHMNSPEVSTKGCATLVRLTSFALDHGVEFGVEDLDICDTLIALLRSQTSSNQNLAARWTCWAIGKLCGMSKPFCTELGGNGACVLLVEALNVFGSCDAQLTEWACFAIEQLSNDEESCVRLGCVGACEAVTDALRRWGSSQLYVAINACAAVAKLAAEDLNKPSFDCKILAEIVALLNDANKFSLSQLALQACWAALSLDWPVNSQKKKLLASGAAMAAAKLRRNSLISAEARERASEALAHLPVTMS